MKIIHVSETSVYNYDGISTYINELIDSAYKNGDEVLVLTAKPYSSHVRKSAVKPEDVKLFPSLRFPGKPKFVTVFPIGFNKTIEDFKPDLIWIHTIGTLGMKAAKFAEGKYRVVYTKHCFDGLMWNTYLKIPPRFHGFLNFWADKFENDILKYVDAAIYHLADVAKIRSNKYFSKFICIAPPLQLRFFENRKVHSHEIGKLILGFCGRCEPDKGLDDTFAGLKIFHEHHPEIALEFILIGDGPEAERLVKEYTFLKITVTGYVDNVIPYYDKLDGYVLTSKHEMIALSSMEALARGLEVFSMPLGYLKESAGKVPGFHMFETHEELAELIDDTLIKEYTSKKVISNKEILNSILISYPELYSKILFGKGNNPIHALQHS